MEPHSKDESRYRLILFNFNNSIIIGAEVVLDPVYQYSFYNSMQTRDCKESSFYNSLPMRDKPAQYEEVVRSCSYVYHSTTDPIPPLVRWEGKRAPVPRTRCYIKQEDLVENMASKVDDIAHNSSQEELNEILWNKSFVSRCPLCAVKVKVDEKALGYNPAYMNKLFDKFKKEDVRRSNEQSKTMISAFVVGLFGLFGVASIAALDC